MKGWQIICPVHKIVLAEVHGDYKRGDVAPPEAYVMKKGIKKPHPTLKGKETIVCPRPHVVMFKPRWKKL